MMNGMNVDNELKFSSELKTNINQIKFESIHLN